MIYQGKESALPPLECLALPIHGCLFFRSMIVSFRGHLILGLQKRMLTLLSALNANSKLTDQNRAPGMYFRPQ
jgi:hypothetical protein